ncbi:MAG: anthranilate synthase component I [Pyrinomonadaceae bacterium]|jgi:anthranilate synthase component 1|nr:anthranilate synthase component I [Acidobacteriota bacterium]
MLKLYPQTFEEFLKLSETGNVVPVVRSVMADLHTPVGAFLRVAENAKQSFLFESVEGGEQIARYSFLAANPFMTVRSHNSQTVVEKVGEEKFVSDQKLFDFLREHFETNKLARQENLPPLCGGAIGFIAYDAARWFEKALDFDQDFEKDDAVWMFFRNILVFDRLNQKIEIVSMVMTDEAQNNPEKLRQLFENAVAETEKIEKLLQKNLTNNFEKLPKSLEKSSEFTSNWKKEDFLRAVEAIKEKILAGDCYQVVLSQKFQRQISALPINVYRALRMTNPSPYMFYIKFGEENLIGASPEMLIRCHERKLEYRPIAGTRIRGKNIEEDLILAGELRADTKEISEHTMLVDLGRNDLGRVAEFGSVEVETLMKVEKYSHVQHLVTSLKANLRVDFDRFDALAACFPAGTVSGAPKVRAMQIIDQLEPTKRNIYAGAIGYIDYAENLDTCIAIRTISLQNGTASIQAGAGIVADSIPESEYEETLNKARALIRAIEIAEMLIEN